MNTKLKEELLDLAHLLHQAIITDDDRVAEAALADLIDAVASMKKVKVEGEGEQLNGSNSSVQPATCNLQPESRRSTFKLLRADKMATMVMRGYPEGYPKPVVAHIQKFAHYCTAEIFRDGDQGPIVDLTVYGGFDRTRRVTQGTMRGLMSSIGKHCRMTRNKRAREDSGTQVNG